MDNYILGEKIGGGAFSKVYKAIHRTSNYTVALKVTQLDEFDEEYRKLIVNEVKLLGRVKCVNVITLFDAFVTPEKCFVMSLEFADYGDLSSLMEDHRVRGELFSERSIWYYFYQICNGLKALHSQRILHRDLKPANIFLTSRAGVLLGDLGLGRAMSDKTRMAKTRVGSEYYLSPERNSQCGYHFKSDIWALGCILYEFAVLRSPFNGEFENAYALHKRIEACERLPFANSSCYSRQLMYTVDACMAVKPENRPTAEELHKASHKILRKFEEMKLKYQRKCFVAM